MRGGGGGGGGGTGNKLRSEWLLPSACAALQFKPSNECNVASVALRHTKETMPAIHQKPLIVALHLATC
jgi:hypothetical protein